MILLRQVRQLGTRLAIKEWASLRSPARRCLSLIRHPNSLIQWLTPVNYTRQREFVFVFDSLARFQVEPKKVLDISSPKLLPVSIALACPGVWVSSTDILESEVRWVKKAVGLLGLKNMTAEVQDARKLPFEDGQFDLVTSVSVFEHIAPEKDGEVPAARELGRVLAPGGIALLTVPFCRNYFAEYQAGRVYERSSPNEEPIFYQRFYDMALLQKNLAAASGLDLVSVKFIEERFFSKNPRQRLANYINGTSRQTLAFGLFYPLLARIFLSAPKPLEQCRKPYLACLVLRKPSGILL